MGELPPFRVVAAGDVDLEFARDEGEGFETVEDWRRAHERILAVVALAVGAYVVALAT